MTAPRPTREELKEAIEDIDWPVSHDGCGYESMLKTRDWLKALAEEPEKKSTCGCAIETGTWMCPHGNWIEPESSPATVQEHSSRMYKQETIMNSNASDIKKLPDIHTPPDYSHDDEDEDVIRIKHGLWDCGLYGAEFAERGPKMVALIDLVLKERRHAANRESPPSAMPDEKKLILKPRFSRGPNGDLFAGYNQVGGDVSLDDDEVEYVVYYRGEAKAPTPVAESVHVRHGGQGPG